MHYPWWYVPHLTGPMLIAAIAVVHVLVSHYAAGGGLFLAVETRHAYRTQNRDYLASPLATEVLIRTFVFGWAIEWVFFMVEINSAFMADCAGSICRVGAERGQPAVFRALSGPLHEESRGSA